MKIFTLFLSFLLLILEKLSFAETISQKALLPFNHFNIMDFVNVKKREFELDIINHNNSFYCVSIELGINISLKHLLINYNDKAVLINILICFSIQVVVIFGFSQHNVIQSIA